MSYHIIITITEDGGEFPGMDLTSTYLELDGRQKDEIRYAILKQAMLVAKTMIDKELTVGDSDAGPELGWEYRAAMQRLAATGILEPDEADDA